MRFGVIGTGAIVEKFIEAGRKCEGFALQAVCSRTMDRAREFAAAQGAPLAFDNLEDLAACREVDAVYIASPNYAHCGQALQMLNAGKHVLCEKPMASNASEVRRMQACAKENGVVLLEAMKSVFEPSFDLLRATLPLLGKLRRATLSYCQYSSRYDKFKQGIVLNAFNPKLSNGALMDIGVYCVHPAVKLFGMPRSIQATGVKLTGGVDGAGSLLLGYGDFQVEAIYSKIADGLLPSEFQGEAGSLLVDRISVPQELTLCLRGKARQALATQKEPSSMRFEIEAFQRLASGGGDTRTHDRASLETAMVMDEARRQMGIVFPADAM
jgi:predicted dehydrogenase